MWCEQHPAANIGLLTGGINNICVIDCDDPLRTLESLDKEFGQTPLVTKTSRGHHLFFSYTGEPSTKIDKIDVLSDGRYVMIPPSVNSDTQHTYAFIEGCLQNLLCLPNLESPIKASTAGIENNASKSEKIDVGNRNTTLFAYLRKIARETLSFEDLLEKANLFSEGNFLTPLPKPEIISTTKQVWKYKQTGRLLTSSTPGTVLYDWEAHKLRGHAKALVLYMFLKKHHMGYRDIFFIDQDKVGILTGLGDRRNVQKALKVMEGLKILRCVEKRRGHSKCNRYEFIK